MWSGGVVGIDAQSGLPEPYNKKEGFHTGKISAGFQSPIMVGRTSS